MSSNLRTGELTKMMNLVVKADLDLCEADVRFLLFCRRIGFGKLTGVLIKSGIVVMADTVRHDVRFDVESVDLT